MYNTSLNVTNVLLWVITGTIFFGLIVPDLRVKTHESMCTVDSFDVNPRFACYTNCNPTERAPEDAESCLVLERDTLETHSAWLCYKNKFGLDAFDDEWYYDYELLCPNDNVVCDGGRRLFQPHTRCELSCPLSYNLTVGFDLDGKVLQENRDLGIDEATFKRFRETYKVGDKMVCRIAKDIHKNEHVLFFDDNDIVRFVWWKWLLYSAFQAAALITAAFAIRDVMARRRRTAEYSPLL